MRLEIDANEMKIVTETVQDVAYLQHMGCGSTDTEMMLKVCVHRTHGPKLSSNGGIEISIAWEDARTASSEGSSGEIVRDWMQFAGSYNIERKKYHEEVKNSSDDSSCYGIER